MYADVRAFGARHHTGWRLTWQRDGMNTPAVTALSSLLVIPLNAGVFFAMVSSKPSELDLWQGLFFLFAAVQLGLGIAAVVTGVKERRTNAGGRVWPIVVGVLGALAAPVGAVLAWLALAIGGASA